MTKWSIIWSPSNGQCLSGQFCSHSWWSISIYPADNFSFLAIDFDLSVDTGLLTEWTIHWHRSTLESSRNQLINFGLSITRNIDWFLLIDRLRFSQFSKYHYFRRDIVFITWFGISLLNYQIRTKLINHLVSYFFLSNYFSLIQSISPMNTSYNFCFH